ncbi:hypothetical protein ACL2XO_09220 [Sodalis sp. RH15]|uniref:hypothetical protein n=1 Tax=Sodalis sp. RH15 TaxID=3394330 RepID=UPI0039B4F349
MMSAFSVSEEKTVPIGTVIDKVYFILSGFAGIAENVKPARNVAEMNRGPRRNEKPHVLKSGMK